MSSTWRLPLQPMDNMDTRQLLIAVTPVVAAAATCCLLYSYRKALLIRSYKFLVALRSDRRGRVYLQGNYAPVVEEATEAELEVEGSLPEGLEGSYIRTGPNPAMPPLGSYHWFDGDGMLHAVRLRGGKASYCSRFVETARIQQERKLGAPLFQKLGDMFGKTGLLVLLMERLMGRMGILRKENGAGTANTALVYHAKKLLALHEGDLPYQMRALCNGVLETVGRLQLKGWERSFTAHPKVDPDTGKLHFFGYSGDSKPYLQYGMLGQDGALEASTAVTLPEPVMMHDFAITRSYAVFLDLPLCIEPQLMVKENRLPIVFKDSRDARIGLLPLGSSSEAAIRWFTLPPFMVFHTANAWEEEDGTVQVVACRFNRIVLELEEMQPENAQYLYRFTLDPATGSAAMEKMSDVAGDFPVVHPALVGRKAAFTYMATFDSAKKFTEFSGIAKMQLYGLEPGTDACVGHIHLPKGCSGGEAVFVPRHDDVVRCGGEDDGYLLLYVYYAEEGVSKLHVYDAKTMAQQPVAVVSMRRRVPFGFHGTFVREPLLQQS